MGVGIGRRVLLTQIGALILLCAPRAVGLGAQTAVNGPGPSSAKTTGTLIVRSDPPGLYVSVDDGDRAETPASFELAPGTHSLQGLATVIDAVYYEDLSTQPIALTAGSVLTVDLKPQRAKASLDILYAPPGFTVFVNDERVGETPIDRLRVDAGPLAVRFERAGEQPRLLYANAAPETTNSVSWGLVSVTARRLENRSIKLDGKRDSWAGIDPIYDGSDDHMVFMDEEGYGISRFYLCRDAKNLYFRLDFEATNPFQRIPTGIKKALIAQLTVRMDDSRSLNFILGYFKQFEKTQASWNLWDQKTGKSTPLGDIGAFAFRNSENMLVAAIPLDKVEKYCSGPLAVDAQIANFNGVDFEAGTGSRWTPGRYVDFQKAPQTQQAPEIVDSGKNQGGGPALRLYGGLGITPLSVVATSVMNKGFPGGAMFGATVFFAKNGASRIGVDASYLPMLKVDGSAGSADIGAVPILLTTATGNFATGIGLSIVSSSGTLLDQPSSTGMEITFSASYALPLGIQSAFLAVKTYAFLDLDPFFGAGSICLLAGLDL